MQYGARKELEEAVDADFISTNTVRVLGEYPTELPSKILACLVVE